MLCKYVYMTESDIVTETAKYPDLVFTAIHIHSVITASNMLLKKIEKYTNATDLRHF